MLIDSVNFKTMDIHVYCLFNNYKLKITMNIKNKNNFVYLFNNFF